jgi:predicted acyltransferase
MMNTDKQRYLAVDVMRGITLIAMIIVNDPGSWEHVFPPLLHAEWNGLTPTDYVYPFFLFIVGVSIALAYQPKLDNGEAKKGMV